MCDKLLKNGVDTEKFRLFVMNQFSPGDCIPPPPASVTEIFKAITRHGLWDYFNYSPLMKIAQKFGAGDPEMEGWMQTYKEDLMAYSMVTKLKDYIETDLDVADPNIAKYDPRYNCSVEWKTNFPVDHSLQYLTEVWEAFSCRYLMPDSPPTTLLDRIRLGCVSVTWLVPSHLVPPLIKRLKIDTDFIRKHRILNVMVGDECIYVENTIVSFFGHCTQHMLVGS